MRAIYQQIQELEGTPGLSKHDQLVQGMINAINARIVSKGDLLPSVNNLSKELGFARETIARSYKELTTRGIVESRNRLGFYVSNEDTDQQVKIALLLYAFDSFQETFYKTFRAGVGKTAHIDVFFHHNNISVFENIVSNVRGKYGMYVIAPIPHERTSGILQTLPMDKFLMIDRFEPMQNDDFSYIVQEFERSSYEAFNALHKEIKTFGEMVFYHRPNSDTPIEIVRAFKKFVKDHKVKHRILDEYIPGSLEKDKVYFTINNAELWEMLRDCGEKKLQLGRDVGILSHNDDVVKEIICDGITTYSTDFKEMAQKAAAYIQNRQKIQEVIPTVLIRRRSI
ncbi:MAG TPA: GntR family transcriptional regulator [Dinghuibacter sp.]|uniref:GntR family transcriptional regulator n=1 Tax=Dinghuibacter sp. TaxID=2024697 RepID=UPI002C5DE947|nr:GntR family transcriptional regulator [Dinghuibacter sp.]HTJ10786.1 GntR family transcriptional regulator [Dinghuibacter sp.]